MPQLTNLLVLCFAQTFEGSLEALHPDDLLSHFKTESIRLFLNRESQMLNLLLQPAFYFHQVIDGLFGLKQLLGLGFIFF